MKTLAINFLRNNKTAQIFLAFIGLVILAVLIGKIFPALGGTILCLLLIGGYYGVLFRCLKFCNINFLEEFFNDLPRILLVSALGTIFIICVVNSQQTIYVWDSLQTWEPTLYCEETIFTDPYQALKNLISSINHADYNNFLSILMALPMHIFGRSFFCYVLYVWLMFGFQSQKFLIELISLCKKLFYIGTFGLLMVLPLFFTFFKHILTYDIRTAYSAYTLGLDFSTRYIHHVNYLGIVIYALFIIGLLVSLFNKKLLPHTIFFATWFFTSELLICRVQLIDRQHNYTMLLPFVFAIAILIAFVWSERKAFGAALLFLLTFNLCQSYSLTLFTPNYFTSGYLISVRHDIEDLKKFLNELNELTTRTDKRVYFLASSGEYNSAVLSCIYLPEKHNALQNLIGTRDIDLRDGFPIDFFDADYVVVTDPI